MTDLLDIHSLAPKLDSLVAEARSLTGVDGERLLKQARLLLAKAREAQVSSPPAGEPGAQSAGEWLAVAGRNLPTGEDVMCWRGDACLYGAWGDGRLQLMELTVGEAAWGMRMTSSGASYFATPGVIEGPADRRILDRIKRDTRAERQRVAREVAARSWVCPRCSWVNEQRVKLCAFCGTVDPPWELTAPHPTHAASHGPAEGSAVSGIPEPEKQLTLDEAGMDWPQGFGERDAVTEVWGNIVLDAVDPNRKLSIVRAVIDAAEWAGAGRLGLAEAKALVEHLPAIVCRNIPATQAAEIQRHLDDAGASTRFERGHD